MRDVLEQTKRKLLRKLAVCYQGWWQWHKIAHRKSMDPYTAVILMPSDNKHYNYYALLHLDEMLSARGFRGAVILTFDRPVQKSALLFSKNIKEVVPFSRAQAEQLMQYACLYNFDNRLVIASLEEPEGRKGETLVGKRGISREEVFAVGVYKIYPKQISPPNYKGSDPDVRHFLEKRGNKSESLNKKYKKTAKKYTLG